MLQTEGAGRKGIEDALLALANTFVAAVSRKRQAVFLECDADGDSPGGEGTRESLPQPVLQPCGGRGPREKRRAREEPEAGERESQAAAPVSGHAAFLSLTPLLYISVELVNSINLQNLLDRSGTPLPL
jgi:hypothetical protein